MTETAIIFKGSEQIIEVGNEQSGFRILVPKRKDIPIYTVQQIEQGIDESEIFVAEGEIDGFMKGFLIARNEFRKKFGY